MSALALWCGIACVVATGMFYSVAELRAYGSDWATRFCQEAPVLCGNPLWLAGAAGLLLFFYFVVERFEI